MELTILMPCLDEEQTIGVCVKKAVDSLSRLGVDGEVLVSDNGSSDQSIEIAKREGARVVHCPLRGYGAALMHGIQEARGDHVVFADADDTYDFSDITMFVDAMRTGQYDLVIGTRLKGHIEEGAMPFLHRRLGTPALTRLINLLYGARFSDCNSGMRLISKKAYARLGMQSPGMEFASEMLVKSAVLGLSVTEVPITLYRDRRGREPHLRTWRDGWRHLKSILFYAPRWVFVAPGVVAVALGVTGLAVLAWGPVRIGGRLISYHTMFVAAMLLLSGVNWLLLGAVAAEHFPLPRRDSGLLRKIGRASFDLLATLSAGLILTGTVLFGWIMLVWAERGFQNIAFTHQMILVVALVASGSNILVVAFFKEMLSVFRLGGEQGGR